MYIEDLDAKRALVGAGARVLFYPTLLYNVIRNKLQSGFHWWDEVDQYLLLGAVPFPKDVPHLKELGVQGVITLNEPYETLVPTSLYRAHGIDHLVIPTRDYLFAPSFGDIRRAVDFIQRNASCGRTTYVHCKAGRGRSTTIVLCYLVESKQMTPTAALEYVRSSRPRVLLAPSQWRAVIEFDRHRFGCPSFPIQSPPCTFDETSIVIVTNADLEGYIRSAGSDLEGKKGTSMVYRVQVATTRTVMGVARASVALVRFSCIWLGCHAQHRIFGGKIGEATMPLEVGDGCSPVIREGLMAVTVDVTVC
ncbi:putative dual specificity protein phosphatase DSP8 [Amborella trichopoda]|uniref:phosphatidylglycerophosphatase n=1 Tax=Amborella trichopoda TaxID=13333 RepID=U5CZ08_AMBTC|nr:putative dual specificity protein phosphatase DSP8 [Amborella trichopoda]ERN15205.1 hypothetical protein AMTR_s00056p00175170 [Amborella trichopoda]|eukprot:XP_006853738.1 putative dual specificity protein phosphatase DSP8 [Amborella trichopoda]